MPRVLSGGENQNTEQPNKQCIAPGCMLTKTGGEKRESSEAYGRSKSMPLAEKKEFLIAVL